MFGVKAGSISMQEKVFDEYIEPWRLEATQMIAEVLMRHRDGIAESFKDGAQWAIYSNDFQTVCLDGDLTVSKEVIERCLEITDSESRAWVTEVHGIMTCAERQQEYRKQEAEAEAEEVARENKRPRLNAL